MIWPVVPGTVGFGHGSAAVVAVGLKLGSPTPAPPEVAVAVGADGAVGAGTHWLGDCVGPLNGGSAVLLTAGVPLVVGAGLAGNIPAPPPPLPPVLALALAAPVSANAAKLGSIRRIPRMSLSWACGVS